MHFRNESASDFADPQCTWCDRNDVRLDKDHIFPRALGGTKELWVPSCRICQTVISKLERQAARQSHYSLFCLTHGPAGRDKRKPSSGLIRARYVLSKHPLGGYGEVAIHAGADTPPALAHIEIDYAEWSSSEGPAGTPHWLSLVYDKRVVQRVAAKIACGLMFHQFGREGKAEIGFRHARDFVLGNSTHLTESSVTELRLPGTE